MECHLLYRADFIYSLLRLKRGFNRFQLPKLFTKRKIIVFEFLSHYLQIFGKCKLPFSKNENNIEII